MATIIAVCARISGLLRHSDNHGWFACCGHPRRSCENRYNTIEDLIQLLDDNPHWVEALRTRLLTRELIELPEKFANFVEVANQRFDRIEGRLDRVEERLDRVEGRLDRLTDDVGILKGAHARSTALRDADVIAEDMGLTLVRVLSRDDLRALTPAQGVADIPTSQLRSFRLADLIMEVANPDGETSFVAVGNLLHRERPGPHKSRAQRRFPVPFHGQAGARRGDRGAPGRAHP